MNKYSVKLLFKYGIEDSDRTFFEERICLFHADSFNKAFEISEKAAQSEEYEYTNIYGKRVSFRFFAVVEAFELCDISEFEDGSEVFSAHFEMQSSNDDPLEKRYKSCRAEDMYILRGL